MSKLLPLFLASTSPRRQHLLAQVGRPPAIVSAHTEEVWPALPPSEAAVHVARDKVQCARAKFLAAKDPDDIGLWLAADTVVVVDDDILGKPVDDADAARMLRAMAGRTHEVITGFVVVRGQHEHAQAVTTRVTMRQYSEQEIEAYVRTGEARDKSGAYAIQSGGTVLSERLEGSLSNVVGLPMAEVLAAFARLSDGTCAP